MSSGVQIKNQPPDDGLIHELQQLEDDQMQNSLLNETNVIEPIPEPEDAVVEISVEQPNLFAFIHISEPKNGGLDVTEKQIKDTLANNKIVFGVDNNKIEEIVNQKLYGEKFIIARGENAIDGINGQIEDFYSRDNKIHFVEAKDGSVDYKDLKKFIAVEKNALICRRTHPTAAIPGRTVFGAAIYGKDGTPAILPSGHNTSVSEDGTELRALVRGSLEFIKDKFQVITTYNVQENVDNSVGNIDFPGDVIVQGDVCEGFSVKAQGNVIVKGTVEGASIFADGNIELSNGMNGMLKGTLNAKKSIKAKYLENCFASANENIQTESVVNSNISCGCNLIVQGKRGAIIGGTCSVGNSIEAREIGSKIHTATQLILGITSEVIHERTEIQKKLKDLEEEAQVIALNLSYLEQQIKGLPATDKKMEVYNLLKRKHPINLMAQSRFMKQLEVIEEKINNINNCSVRCAYIYPPTKLSFGNTVSVIRNETQRCIFTCEKGEVICKSY